MSKKIIALVLFVAMMLMMVPAANAADSVYSTDGINAKSYRLTIQDDGWFASGAVSNDVLDNKKVEGVTVGISADSTSSKSVTIDLKGSYKDLLEFNYNVSSIVYTPVGKAVKIPFVVEYNQGDSSTQNWANITASTYVNNYLAGADAVASGSTVKYYLTVLPTEENSTTVFTLYVGGGTAFTVNVNWTNTDNTSSSSTGYVKFNASTKSGSQKDNFNVSIDAQTSKAAGTIYFNVAKRTEADSKTIDGTTVYPTDILTGDAAEDAVNSYALNTITSKLELVAQASGKKVTIGTYADAAAAVKAYNAAVDAYFKADTMSVKLQAINKAGNVYPAGTLVDLTSFTASNYYPAGATAADVKDLLLTGTRQYPTLGGTSLYVVDDNGCITLNIRGIVSWKAWGGTTGTTAYMVPVGQITLAFQSGSATAETAIYDIVLRNVGRSNSGVTVLDSEVVMEVGETYTVQFTFDDDDALDKAVTWKSVSSAIVKVTDAAKGKIEAKAIGETYVYVNDAKDNTYLVKVIVVEDKDEYLNPSEPEPTDPTDPEPTDGETYIVTASALNVRKGPGTSYSKVGSLKRGAEVVVIGEVNNGAWMEIEAVDGFKDADNYYVSGKYLSLAD